MVAIAIVAILAAVSVGAYKQYVLRVKITSAMNTLDIFMDEAVKVHQLTGAFPTSYSVNGTDVGHCVWVWVDWSETNTGWFSYCNNGSGVTFTNSLLNLESLPGYTAPTNSVRTDFSQVSAAVRYNSDGTYTK